MQRPRFAAYQAVKAFHAFFVFDWKERGHRVQGKVGWARARIADFKSRWAVVSHNPRDICFQSGRRPSPQKRLPPAKCRREFHRSKSFRPVFQPFAVLDFTPGRWLEIQVALDGKSHWAANRP